MANNNEQQRGPVNQQPEKKDFRITVEEPQVFNPTLKSKYITTIDLAKIVNKLFKSVFSDFEGCTLIPDQFGVIQVALFFKEKGPVTNPTLIKNIKPAVDPANKNDIMSRINFINGSRSGRKFDLTEETKEALHEFMFGGLNAKINWNQCVAELTEQTYNGVYAYIKVFGIDVMRVIKKIYGNKVDGNYVDYQLNIVRPTNSNVNGNGMVATSNFLLMLSQLDTKMVEDLYREIGMVPVQGQLPIIRD